MPKFGGFRSTLKEKGREEAIGRGKKPLNFLVVASVLAARGATAWFQSQYLNRKTGVPKNQGRPKRCAKSMEEAERRKDYFARIEGWHRDLLEGTTALVTAWPTGRD